MKRRLASLMATPPRWLRVVTWLLVAVAMLVTQYSSFVNRVPVTGDWRQFTDLIDFRDAAWLPTRYLIDGGNPYDTPPYVAAHPWAQELNLYAPVWLVLAIPFALLPWSAAVGLYLVVGPLLLVVTTRVAWRLLAPSYAAWGVPLSLVWAVLWGPTRYALQNGGTLLPMLGAVLAIEAMSRASQGTAQWRHAVPGEHRMGGLRLALGGQAALGVALALIKPQFGLVLFVLLLAMGWWRTCLKAVIALSLASLPALLSCVIAAGGVAQFVASLGRNLAFASSPDSPTGLNSAFNQRVDYLGLAARWGLGDLPSVVALLVLAGLLVAALLVIRAGLPEAVVMAAVTIVMSLALVHQPYDLLPLFAVAVLAVAAWLDDAWPDGLSGWVVVLACVPVIHLQSLTLRLGLNRLAGDSIVVLALTVSLALAVVMATRRIGADDTMSAFDEKARNGRDVHHDHSILTVVERKADAGNDLIFSDVWQNHSSRQA